MGADTLQAHNKVFAFQQTNKSVSVVKADNCLMMGDGSTCNLDAMFDKMQMNPRIKCSAVEVAICKKIERGLFRSQFSFELTSLVIQVASSCHNHVKTTRQQ